MLHRLDPSCRETVDTKHLWVNPTDTTDALAAAGVAGVGVSGAALPHSSSQAALAPAQVTWVVRQTTARPLKRWHALPQCVTYLDCQHYHR